jgi:hypothetical protein
MRSRILLCIMLLWLTQSVRAVDLRGDTIDIGNYQLHIDLRDFEGRTIIHCSVFILEKN